MATDCLTFLLADTSAPHLDSGTWFALALASVATFFIFARSKTKRRKDPLERHPVSSSLAQERAVERQMSNLLMELTDMSRSLSAQLDTRVAKLEALLDEADKRIAELRSANQATVPSTPHQNDSIPITRQPDPLVSPTDDRYAQIYSLAQQGRSAQEIAVLLGQPSGEIELILALRSRAAV